jgi:hypothetical protein
MILYENIDHTQIDACIDVHVYISMYMFMYVYAVILMHIICSYIWHMFGITSSNRNDLNMPI